MERDFEKSLCLSSGVIFAFLSFSISLPNAIILIALYRNPLRCFRKPFVVYLVFIAAMDLLVGTIVCPGEAVMRFFCAFGDEEIPKDGDIVKILGYIGVNSSILLVTAMSVDRFISVVVPHFYLKRVTPRKLVVFNTIIICFSSIFASLQLAGISMDVYILIDIHLHTTSPLVITTLSYFGMFLFLRKRARVHLQRQTLDLPGNPTLQDMRRLNIARTERKFATTSFLILIFLVISLIPYFVSILIDTNCYDCRGQKWLSALQESSVTFLFVNSLVNPLLTTFRINELKQSVLTIFWRRHQNSPRCLGDFELQSDMRHQANIKTRSIEGKSFEEERGVGVKFVS